jgi:hypothetical protein
MNFEHYSDKGKLANVAASGIPFLPHTLGKGSAPDKTHQEIQEP